MRRTFLVLMVAATTLVVAGGVALAAALDGGPGDDTIFGTKTATIR